MDKPLYHKILFYLKNLLLTWMKSIKKAFKRISEGLSRYPGKRRTLLLLGVFLVLLMTAWSYIFEPGTSEQSAPLLIGEDLAPNTNSPKTKKGEEEVIALARLEKEITELRNKVEELTKAEGVNKEREFAPTDFSRPVPGQIVRGPGWLRSGKEWRYHSGVDITLPGGNNVMVCADGRVEEVKTDPALGTIIRINHGSGWTSLYGHITEVSVSVNQEVKKGTILGKTSSSTCGPEPGIHFGLFYQGKEIDPRSIIPGL